jgi:hypothetical protein
VLPNVAERASALVGGTAAVCGHVNISRESESCNEARAESRRCCVDLAGMELTDAERYAAAALFTLALNATRLESGVDRHGNALAESDIPWGCGDIFIL